MSISAFGMSVYVYFRVEVISVPVNYLSTTKRIGLVNSGMVGISWEIMLMIIRARFKKGFVEGVYGLVKLRIIYKCGNVWSLA